MSEAQFLLCEKLLKKNRQLKEEVERLRSLVSEVTVERLRDLVREAYAEGFNDGGLAAHPMGPNTTHREGWEKSTSREDLGDE